MRTSRIERNTNETKITLELNIDGSGKSDIKTGSGFLDHMLTLFASHGRFDLKINCDGDTYVDDHHSVEDIGICLGMAFKEALGDKAGINRYGFFVLPMDEALVTVSLDFSGRSYLNFDCVFPSEKIGSFDTELVNEFMYAFVRTSAMTLHIKKTDGDNSHHIAEAIFKGLARSIKTAATVDPTLNGELPSTKGKL